MKLARASSSLKASAGASHRCRRACVLVRAEGVQDLLARDRKTSKLAKELTDEPAKPAGEVVKARETRRKDARERKEESADPQRPKRCKEAIDKGLELFKEKQYEQAIAMFNLALELPGNGAYRLQGSPREYSCPSDAEEQAALYNSACAYAQLQQPEAALTCLEAVLDTGFEDYATLRSDPDLAPVRRSPGFEQLLGRYEGPLAKLKKMLPGGSGDKVLKSDTNKPWVLW